MNVQNSGVAEENTADMMQESDFVDDIVGDDLPTHVQPANREFAPWHRVRKQFIRQYQWNEWTTRMLKRYWLDVLTGNSPLRCLVIPGDDLLDVRSLYRHIDSSIAEEETKKWRIRYLGFNEKNGSDIAGTRLHIANNTVTSFPQVETDSIVVRDRFESIASLNSQAYQYLKSYGPYHIVNLDFCGSLFPNTSSSAQKYHDSLHQLLAYQFKNTNHRWLLFITTEVEANVVDNDRMRTFCGPLRDNSMQHANFADILAKLLPLDIFEEGDAIVNLSDLNQEQMVDLFGVSLGKWLLLLCHTNEPKWTILMRPSYQYTINEEKSAVMLCFAFELFPNIVTPVDTSGISAASINPPKYKNEEECAVQIVNIVQDIQDVDMILRDDVDMKTSLRDSKADLLAEAGFDRDAYFQWLSENDRLEQCAN